MVFFKLRDGLELGGGTNTCSGPLILPMIVTIKNSVGLKLCSKFMTRI